MADSTLIEFDSDAIVRVHTRCTLADLQLVGAYFKVDDDGPLDPLPASEVLPTIGIDTEWEFDVRTSVLGCVLTFGTLLDGGHPYEVTARFRAVYTVAQGPELPESDLNVFVQYNAVHHVWPFWREYLSSTLNRAQLPRFLVPLLRLPAMPGLARETGHDAVPQ